MSIWRISGITSLLALALVLISGCADPADSPDLTGYQVIIERDGHGVVHITADEFGSLGYGEGYAAAEDHVCNIAWAFLEVRGELARFHGPGPDRRHLISDVAVAALDIDARAEALLADQPAIMKEWLEGFAAGYNRYVAEHDGAPGSWCAGESWVRSIDAGDLARRMVFTAMTLSRTGSAMVSATPPGQTETSRLPVSDAMIARAAEATALPDYGSNAWALGRKASANGRGLLLANPHYPWYGPNRFWEKRLHVPGQLLIHGANLVGAPGVAIGFTRQMAWSHTVSASQRLVFYRLQLVPGEPTRYRYGEEQRDMQARTVSVAVRNVDGELEEHEQTVWFSHYGPVLNLPGFEWNDEVALTVRDANEGNHWMMQQWLAMAQSESMDEFIKAHADWNAMAWINTIAASREGRAAYIDGSNVGNLSDATIARWHASLDEEPQVARAWQQRGWLVLDGSDPDNEWVATPGALMPYVVPFADKPLLERDDMVFNANDSYWLSHPEVTLADHSPLYGTTATARSLRTRMNALLLGGDAGAPFRDEYDRFDRAGIRAALFDNESLAARLLLKPLLEACLEQPHVALEETTIELQAACDALAGFDGRMDLDRPGAVLFREWLGRYSYAQTLAAGALFAEPFSGTDPLGTPTGLADAELARQHLARAVQVLAAADLPLDATLAQTQFAWRGDRPIAVHGGNGNEGVANLMISRAPDWPTGPSEVKPIADSQYLTDHGYPIVHGSSFVMVVGWNDDGPVADVMLTYGQSGDPYSPHFTDQTEAFAEKRWRQVLLDPVEATAGTGQRRVLQGKRAEDSE